MIDRSIGCDERVDSKDAKASLSYIVPNDILIAQNKGLIINGLPYDSHWNDIGNRIAGQSIFKAISSYLTNK